MQQALIIFIRNPELGKVKTRIGQVAGDALALQVYKNLLAHTQAITMHLQADKYVYYADAIHNLDIWANDTYFKAKQEGPDLGARMHQAFSTLFKKGYEKVCIIGSDCYELTAPIIESAFKELDTADMVIGPAKDGGYYLLGMKKEVREVFYEIDWSTDKVLEQTLLKLKDRYTYALLPTLSDIDTIEDVPKDWIENNLLI
jgi:uncharacterized protein